MISVFGSNVGAAEIAHASDSIARQWMGIGPKVETFEQMFSERLRLSGLAMLSATLT
jgi:dTDP-4-amino-4,6-dideoxygalactose transaminase